MNTTLQTWLTDQLQALRDQSLYKPLVEMQTPQGGSITVDGKRVVNLSSNNYLGLANHPKLKEAAVRAAAGAGLVVHPVHAIPPLDHAFTHFRLRLIPVVCAQVSVVSRGAAWLTASQIRARPVSTSHRLALAGASLIH